MGGEEAERNSTSVEGIGGMGTEGEREFVKVIGGFDCGDGFEGGGVLILLLLLDVELFGLSLIFREDIEGGFGIGKEREEESEVVIEGRGSGGMIEEGVGMSVISHSSSATAAGG